MNSQPRGRCNRRAVRKTSATLGCESCIELTRMLAAGSPIAKSEGSFATKKIDSETREGRLSDRVAPPSAIACSPQSGTDLARTLLRAQRHSEGDLTEDACHNQSCRGSQ